MSEMSGDCTIIHLLGMTEQAVGSCEYAEQVVLGKILDLKKAWLPLGGNKRLLPLGTLHSKSLPIFPESLRNISEPRNKHPG